MNGETGGMFMLSGASWPFELMVHHSQLFCNVQESLLMTRMESTDWSA